MLRTSFLNYSYWFEDREICATNRIRKTTVIVLVLLIIRLYYQQAPRKAARTAAWWWGNGRRLADGGDTEAISRQEKEERNPSLIVSGNCSKEIAFKPLSRCSTFKRWSHLGFLWSELQINFQKLGIQHFVKLTFLTEIQKYLINCKFFLNFFSQNIFY